jgi:hypothetical protein
MFKKSRNAKDAWKNPKQWELKVIDHGFFVFAYERCMEKSQAMGIERENTQ